MFRKRLGLEKSIMKFLRTESAMNVFSAIGRVRWDRGEDTISDHLKISFLYPYKKRQTKNTLDFLIGSKGSGVKV